MLNQIDIHVNRFFKQENLEPTEVSRRANLPCAARTLTGARLAYTREGTGQPLLCLHGGMGIDSASLRVAGIRSLAARGCDVVIVDHRGHGESSAIMSAECTHETWATDAFKLTRHLGWKKFALLGHSYGGFIALEYAVRWPHTLTHLILVATSAGPVRFVPAPCSRDDELRQHFEKIWPAFFVGSNKHWELFESLRFSAAPYRAAFDRELPNYDLRFRMRSLEVPALLIVGSEDRYRRDMEWLAEELPSASLHIVERVGHFPFVEAPEEFLDAVSRFISGERKEMHRGR